MSGAVRHIAQLAALPHLAQHLHHRTRDRIAVFVYNFSRDHGLRKQSEAEAGELLRRSKIQCGSGLHGRFSSVLRVQVAGPLAGERVIARLDGFDPEAAVRIGGGRIALLRRKRQCRNGSGGSWTRSVPLQTDRDLF